MKYLPWVDWGTRIIAIISLVTILVYFLPHGIYIEEEKRLSENWTAAQKLISPPMTSVTTINNYNASKPMPPVTVYVNWGIVINKIANPNYDAIHNPNAPRFIFQEIGYLPPVPQELYGENAIIIINYKLYIGLPRRPIQIDSLQLSVDGGKPILSPPQLIKTARPEDETAPYLWMGYFKYEGIISTGLHQATLIVTTENTSVSSDPFSITIPEPNKQER